MYFIVESDHFFNYSWSQAFPVHNRSGTGERAKGEQIDLLSGNLNFTLPLLRAPGRGGWGVAFSLNYNAANFRKDTVATWKLGRDSGYGCGFG